MIGMSAKSIGLSSMKRFAVILVHPQHPENIGLVARSMKNTGFRDLRLVKVKNIKEKAYVTAVHAREILEKTRFYPDIVKATGDLDLVFAATSKKRKNFSSFPLENAVHKMFHFPSVVKIGLLFGNERTGLTSEDLKRSNFRFTIPQAAKQPSYNLASAVLLTLFAIYTHENPNDLQALQERPIPREEQDECIRLILEKMEKSKFIHNTNQKHVEEMIHDLFGRLTMTERDRKLLLALFSKGME